MLLKTRKWGNSLAIRIPKALAQEAGLEDGSEVDLAFVDGCLIVTPHQPAPALDELIAGITPDNVHTEQDFGAPLGREAW